MTRRSSSGACSLSASIKATHFSIRDKDARSRSAALLPIWVCNDSRSRLSGHCCRLSVLPSSTTMTSPYFFVPSTTSRIAAFLHCGPVLWSRLYEHPNECPINILFEGVVVTLDELCEDLNGSFLCQGRAASAFRQWPPYDCRRISSIMK